MFLTYRLDNHAVKYAPAGAVVVHDRQAGALGAGGDDEVGKSDSVMLRAPRETSLHSSTASGIGDRKL
jgi:hypothetical protein